MLENQIYETKKDIARLSKATLESLGDEFKDRSVDDLAWLVAIKLHSQRASMPPCGKIDLFGPPVPEEFSELEMSPMEVKMRIFSYTDDLDLLSFCTTNSQILKICTHDEFDVVWKQRIGEIVGQNIMKLNLKQFTKEFLGVKEKGRNTRKTGYMLFSQQERATLKEEKPDLSFAEISQTISARWKQVSKKEKNRWTEEAMEYDEGKYEFPCWYNAWASLVSPFSKKELLSFVTQFFDNLLELTYVYSLDLRESDSPELRGIIRYEINVNVKQAYAEGSTGEFPAWIQFLEKHKGQGKSHTELSAMYKKTHAGKTSTGKSPNYLPLWERIFKKIDDTLISEYYKLEKKIDSPKEEFLEALNQYEVNISELKDEVFEMIK